MSRTDILPIAHLHQRSQRGPRVQHSMDRFRPRALARALAACSMLSMFGTSAGVRAQALPTGAAVAAGQVKVTISGNAMTVTNSDRAIVNWNSFSVGAGASVRFDQPSASSQILNRVTGNDPSSILGSLSSNGKVWLLNPNGVLFGQGARIDVAGLVASTLSLGNADWLAGKFNLTKLGDGTAADVVNQGELRTPLGGRIALIGGTVRHEGLIEAPGGQVMLAAGKTVDLLDTGAPNLTLRVTAPQGEALNLGSVLATGGRIDIHGAIVNQQGVVRADAVGSGAGGRVVLQATQALNLSASSTTSAAGLEGGQVRLDSGATGTTLVSGGISVAGTVAKGGQVQVLGQHVGLMDAAHIDASGLRGGGEVLVGGGQGGKDASVRNAGAVYVGTGVSLNADSTGNGDGGLLNVWSEQATRAYGRFSARGGAQGGNGGFVETSGGWLDAQPAGMDTSASKGRSGTWLLDPYDLFIVAGSPPAAAGAGVINGPTFSSDVGRSRVYADTVSSALTAGSNVVIATGAGGTQAGHISANGVTITHGGNAPVSLALKAHGDINLFESTIRSTGGPLAMSLESGIAGSGAVRITNTAILTRGGDVSLGGPTSFCSGNVCAEGTGAYSRTSAGISLSAASIDAGAGRITARGFSSGAGANLQPNQQVALNGLVVNNTSRLTASEIDLYGFLGSGQFGLRDGVTIFNSTLTASRSIKIVGSAVAQADAAPSQEVGPNILGHLKGVIISGSTISVDPEKKDATASLTIDGHATAREATTVWGVFLSDASRVSAGAGDVSISGRGESTLDSATGVLNAFGGTLSGASIKVAGTGIGAVGAAGVSILNATYDAGTIDILGTSSGSVGPAQNLWRPGLSLHQTTLSAVRSVALRGTAEAALPPTGAAALSFVNGLSLYRTGITVDAASRDDAASIVLMGKANGISQMTAQGTTISESSLSAGRGEVRIVGTAQAEQAFARGVSDFTMTVSAAKVVVDGTAQSNDGATGVYINKSTYRSDTLDLSGRASTTSAAELGSYRAWLGMSLSETTLSAARTLDITGTAEARGSIRAGSDATGEATGVIARASTLEVDRDKKDATAALRVTGSAAAFMPAYGAGVSLNDSTALSAGLGEVRVSGTSRSPRYAFGVQQFGGVRIGAARIAVEGVASGPGSSAGISQSGSIYEADDIEMAGTSSGQVDPTGVAFRVGTAVYDSTLTATRSIKLDGTSMTDSVASAGVTVSGEISGLTILRSTLAVDASRTGAGASIDLTGLATTGEAITALGLNLSDKTIVTAGAGDVRIAGSARSARSSATGVGQYGGVHVGGDTIVVEGTGTGGSTVFGIQTDGAQYQATGSLEMVGKSTGDLVTTDRGYWAGIFLNQSSLSAGRSLKLNGAADATSSITGIDTTASMAGVRAGTSTTIQVDPMRQVASASIDINGRVSTAMALGVEGARFDNNVSLDAGTGSVAITGDAHSGRNALGVTEGNGSKVSASKVVVNGTARGQDLAMGIYYVGSSYNAGSIQLVGKAIGTGNTDYGVFLSQSSLKAQARLDLTGEGGRYGVGVFSTSSLDVSAPGAAGLTIAGTATRNSNVQNSVGVFDSTLRSSSSIAISGRSTLAPASVAPQRSTITAVGTVDISSDATLSLNRLNLQAGGKIGLRADTVSIFSTTTAAGQVLANSITSQAAGDAIVVSGFNQPNALSGSLAPTTTLSAPNGRWLFYMTSRSAFSPSSTTGSASNLYDFREYGAVFGQPTGRTPTIGNGFLYSEVYSATVSTAGLQKVYDGGTSITFANLAPVLAPIFGATSDTVTFKPNAVGNFDTKDAGTGKAVLIDAGSFDVKDFLGKPVYGLRITTTSLGDILPAALTYVANPISAFSGAALPPLTGTVVGFVNGETLSTATTGALNFTSTASSGSPAGSYPIQGSGLLAANYTFSQAPANATALTLTPPPIAINREANVALALGTQQIRIASIASSATEGRVLDAMQALSAGSTDKGSSFKSVAVASMSQDALAALLASRERFMRNVYSESLARLEQDPTLADVRECQDVRQLEQGTCLITEKLKKQISDERQARAIVAAAAQSPTGAPSGSAATQTSAPQAATTVLAAKADARRAPPKRTVVKASIPQISRKVAVVIGIDKYSDERIPALDNSVADALAVGRLLENRLGYEVVPLENGTKAQIIAALNKLAAEVDGDDSVVVYYAGHGALVESSGMGYWQPSNADASKPETWLSNSDINKLIGQIGASQVALVSDSCYSGSLVSKQRIRTAANLNPSQLLSKKSVVVMSSGGNEPVFDSGKNGHSTFAWNLMRSLEQVSSWQAGNNVFERVRFAVARELPQRPQYGASEDAGHEAGGDYLFEQRELGALTN